MIATRLADGRLHELHRGVYLVGHTAPPPHAHEMAALLACGKGAVLSHRSAAHLWSLFSYPAAPPVCVTLPPERYVKRPRIETHRATIDRRDIRARHGLTLTSPPRTILDLAATLDAAHLESVVAEAGYRRLASEVELKDQLGRYPNRRGASSLIEILDLTGGPRRTRSPAERLMLRLLRRAQITGYETNGRIHDYEVDFLWRELSFAVEIDGYDAHSGRVAFERDRLKLATLEARGLVVMPVTGRRLRVDEEGVLGRLIGGLRRAGYSGPLRPVQG
jgi:very-short-patch-repair endonuclease